MMTGSNLNEHRRLNPALRLLTGFGLVLIVFFSADLALHPLSPSAGPIILNDNGTSFRYFSLLAGLINAGVALLVLRRSPGNSLAALLMVWGAGAAGWSIRSDWPSPQVAGWVGVAYYTYFYLLAWPAFTAFLFLYPTGRFYPAGLKNYALILIGFQAAAGVASNLGVPYFGSGMETPNPLMITWLGQNMAILGLLNNLVSILAIFGPLAALVVRFRDAGWQERQQIKWLVWMAVVAAATTALQLFLVPSTLAVQSSSALMQVYSFGLFVFYQALPGLASGIAILRYRLWDIDVIIRRTLVYGGLTALLGLVFLGGVTLLQAVFTKLTGQGSAAATVISTLVIAALFAPLRRRMQETIDRRFYRRKYDAEQALSGFAEAARRETDLQQLSGKLNQTMLDALQPEKVALWLYKK